MKSIASTPFYLVLLVLLMLFLCSCGFVHKVFDKNKVHKKTASLVTNDSTSLKKQESVHVVTAEGTAVKKSEDQLQNDVEVEFSDSSAQNQVEVTMDKAGHHTVRAIGKIKSIKARTQQAARSTDSSHIANHKKTEINSIDSTSLQSSAKNNTVEDSKQLKKEKSAWRITWLGYLLFLLFIILLIIYLRYRKQINAFIKALFQSNASKFKMILLITGAYLLSGCLKKTDNAVKNHKIDLVGFKPGSFVSNRSLNAREFPALLTAASKTVTGAPKIWTAFLLDIKHPQFLYPEREQEIGRLTAMFKLRFRCMAQDKFHDDGVLNGHSGVLFRKKNRYRKQWIGGCGARCYSLL